MRVKVKLIDIFRDFLPPGASYSNCSLEFQDRAVITDIFLRLAVPEDLPRVVLCNGRTAEGNHPLNDGDVVSIFSPIFGG